MQASRLPLGHVLVAVTITLFLLLQLASCARPIPDFSASPDLLSVRSGDWDDVQTWNEGRVPTEDDVVSIESGHDVIVSSKNAQVAVVGVHGLLRFDENSSTMMKVGTLQVHLDGELRIGDCRDALRPLPIKATKTAVIQWQGQVDTDFDPEQYGIGLIGLGKVTVCGAEKKAFSQLTEEIDAAGTSTFDLRDRASGWKEGDRLVIPDTRQLRDSEHKLKYDGGQTEVIAVASVSDRTVTLAAATAFSHTGARNAEHTIERNDDGHAKFTAHVANVDRNVVFQTNANLLATGATARGHSLFFEVCDVNVQYAAFVDMGRTTNEFLDVTTFDDTTGAVTHVGTNQIGRYAIHAHQLSGPIPAKQGSSYQFVLIGNVVERALKWAYTVHNAHYGLVQHNVAYIVDGAAFVCEDGSESYNHFDSNMVIDVHGTGQRATDGYTNPLDIGREGSGFWSRGPNNRFTNNVATNVIVTGPWGFGYTFFCSRVGIMPVPPYRGAPVSEYEGIDMNKMKLLEFNHNQAYGAIQGGLTVWWINSFGISHYDEAEETMIDNFIVWHHYTKGIYLYPCNKLTFNRLIMRGNAASHLSRYGGNTGYFPGDYAIGNGRIVNSDLQGLKYGIVGSVFMGPHGREDVSELGFMLVEDTVLHNWINIFTQSPWSVNGGTDELPARRFIIKDVHFDLIPVTCNSCIEPTNIRTAFNWKCGARLNVLQEHFIINYDYELSEPVNLQLFYKEQHPSAEAVATGVCTVSNGRDIVGVPEAGLTNQQSWDKYGQANAGQIATCFDDTSYPALSTDSGSFLCAFDVDAMLPNLPAKYAIPAVAPAPTYSDTKSAPVEWTCAAAAYDDGDTCDCDCGTKDPDCKIGKPTITAAYHRSDDKMKVKWDTNGASPDACFQVQVKAVVADENKWKTLSRCTKSNKKTYKREKVEKRFTGLEEWSAAVYKVRVRTKDSSHSTFDTCGKLKSNWSKKAKSFIE